MENYVYGACLDTAAHIAGRYSRDELTAAEAWEGFSIVKDFLTESVQNGIQKKM